ncbi:hypothetical protein SKAU_G00316420 [Synaphobranchus kaupii]|uniref:Uncharacterized protein n=1 Tax=Synaphobranchus kaupii TaxID=118154 RepID=A0A9Q1ESW0_SYNKA|nr:hypothetical protein SKAU_G00316420 [Synaphobranchus kaupii]
MRCKEKSVDGRLEPEHQSTAWTEEGKLFSSQSLDRVLAREQKHFNMVDELSPPPQARRTGEITHLNAPT